MIWDKESDLMEQVVRVELILIEESFIIMRNGTF